ncbi:hypothetical protein P691DRAFT_678784, partial [Macrolepiota fuliginosa MF-IS2]
PCTPHFYCSISLSISLSDYFYASSILKQLVIGLLHSFVLGNHISLDCSKVTFECFHRFIVAIYMKYIHGKS